MTREQVEWILRYPNCDELTMTQDTLNKISAALSGADGVLCEGIKYTICFDERQRMTRKPRELADKKLTIVDSLEGLAIDAILLKTKGVNQMGVRLYP